jgi:D-xylose transport system substrate-binding protein
LALLAACYVSEPEAGGPPRSARIGVILPDSKSSARWETADRKYLEAAFKAAGVEFEIQNAQNDRATFETIADQMITSGVTVLMIVNLDSRSGKAVLDRARSQGVATIDYDRLTLGGSASYYVSFDNARVGVLQGEGLVRCLAEREARKPVVAQLNGATTDNNATLFKQGYESVLNPRFQTGQYLKGPDQSVPEWDNAEAALIFAEMMEQTPDIGGVLAANDGLGNAAITVLRVYDRNGVVPVTGQDATVTGLQNILRGDQCMTVYKDIRREAAAASELAIALASGERRDTGRTLTDPTNGRQVPAILLDPVAIHIEDVRNVVTDGFVTRAELCTGELMDECAAARIP